ncbi:MAG: hypothetical protein EOP88_10775 [Verrucomicrobiaceae bacterium]|nr:MAG: hypothetical protein EOP88_10775 [Verrucomicrobiaceae bacterium]
MAEVPLNEPGNSRGIHAMGKMEKLVAGLLLAATTGAVLVFTAGEGLIHRDRPDAQVVLAHSPEVTPPPSPPEPHALAALEAFFEAPELAGKAEQVRDKDRVLPMMVDLHQRRGCPFPTMATISKGKAGMMDGVSMVFFEVEPFSGPRYPVAVVWDGSAFRVDWVSLMAYGTVDWSAFVENRPPETQVLRVFVHSAGKDESSFALGSGETTVQIEHRDDPTPVVGIAAGETASVLKALTEKRRAPVTVEVCWVRKGGVPVIEIVKVLAPQWSL